MEPSTKEGETLFTTARSKSFDVVKVQSDRIIFVPQDGYGTHPWASRAQIETIFDLAKGGKEVSPSMVQEQYPRDQNRSYIAAIVKHMLAR